MRGAILLVALVLASACMGSPERSPSVSTSSSASSPPPPASASPTAASPPPDSFKLAEVVRGLNNPVYVTHAADGSGRIFVVEQGGRIRTWAPSTGLAPTPFLDISDRISTGYERGLLSVAFYPDYATSGRFIVDYTRGSTTPADVGDTVVSRFNASRVPELVSPASEEILLTIDQPQANHNGGLAKFGPDGMLYIGSGDGGGRDDTGPGHAPEGNGQSLSTLLGKLIRIDVREPGAYRIPADNPDLGPGAKKEIWAYGLRNPWRFSFDRLTGDLYIADVGQEVMEEINHQPKSSKGGENYGWSGWEGSVPHAPGPTVSGDTKPVAEYRNIAESHCSVTGGYVYRGQRVPALQGYYIVGDYCSGQLWSLARVNGAWTLSGLIDTPYNISSFGEDEAGELYLVHHGGTIYRFDPV